MLGVSRVVALLLLSLTCVQLAAGGDTLANLLVDPLERLDAENQKTDSRVNVLAKLVYMSLIQDEKLNTTIQGMVDDVRQVKRLNESLTRGLLELKSLAETDHCSSSPCVHGQCRDFLTGYTCQCQPGYTGKNCDDVDDCAANICHGHGKCVDLDGGFECHCYPGYAGSDCQTVEISNHNCQDVLDKDGGAASGVYTLNIPTDSGWSTTRAFCDMDTDGGGWTVFQKRFNGEEDFNRTSQEYADGFGNPAEEYWLGLEWLHMMTSQTEYKMRIDLTAADNSTAYQVYGTFTIGRGPEYSLTVEYSTGNAGIRSRSMEYNNGQPFVTKDNSTNTCIQQRHGAWWYASCSYISLNGEYITPGTVHKDDKYRGVVMNGWKSYDSLKATSMKIKPI